MGSSVRVPQRLLALVCIYRVGSSDGDWGREHGVMGVGTGSCQSEWHDTVDLCACSVRVPLGSVRSVSLWSGRCGNAWCLEAAWGANAHRPSHTSSRHAHIGISAS